MSLPPPADIARKLKELAEHRVQILNELIAMYESDISIISAETISKHSDIASIAREEEKIILLMSNIRSVLWACSKL
jgi:hypothetical protein